MAGPLLRAVAPTSFVTVQDRGRRGWRRFGIASAGAMDRMSLAIANALVGNHPSEAALEFAYAGGDWGVEASSCRVAVTGGEFNVTVDGNPFPPYSSRVLKRGQLLRIGGGTRRVWGYLGVAGGFDLPLEFGSRSTHVRTGIGGLAGRAIRAGDAVLLRADRASDEPGHSMVPPPEPEGPVRLVLGPQEDYFDSQSLSLFLSAEYEVTWQQDRAAYRLQGPPLRHAKGYNIISDGVVPGCIQIIGTGLPLVLMSDVGTVGGYPKIATIITADLGRMAQKWPGSMVRFAAIDVAEAHAIRRRFLAQLQLVAEEGAGVPGPAY
jgi:5-oxoprolinase (ATP-hydrolysing) subunit C